MKHKPVIVVIVLLALIANFVSPWKAQRPIISLAPEHIAHVGSFTITNTLLSGWLAVLLLIGLAFLGSRQLKDIPSARSRQNIIETVFEAFLNFLQNIVGARARTFFPVIATLFLYILLSNYLSLMPGFGSIGLWREEEGQRVLVPLLRGATSDLNTTLALAICSVLSSQIYGIRYRGLVEYGSRFVGIKRFIQFFRELFRARKVHMGLVFGGVLDLFVGILELFEELTKVLSFSFRLFGNIFGGEVLLFVIAFLVPYVASVPFLVLELITGFIQAFIFAVLSTAFFGRATSRESSGPEELAAGLSAVEQPTSVH
jgi:F-type H+-transporting ATPase subunit a